MRAISPVPVTALFSLYLFYWGSGWGLANWPLGAWRSMLALAALNLVWWSARKSNGSHWYPTPVDSLLLPTAGALVVSALGHPERMAEAAIGWWFLGCSTLLFYLVHDLLANRRITLSQLADGLLAGAVIPVVHGIVESLLTGRRAEALFENPNHYGGLMLVIIPIAVARFREERSSRGFVYLGLASVAFVGLCLSGSRGAFLGLAAALLFAPRRVVLTALAIAVPLLAGAIWWRWATVANRFPVYEFAWNGICERPFSGHGLFTFRLWLPAHSEAFLHAHNILLHVAYEVGLIGLAVFVLGAVRLALASRAAGPPGRRGWQTALVGTSIHQLVDVTWLFPMMFVMLPVLVAAATVRFDEEPRRNQRGFTGLMAAAWALLIAIGFLSGGIPPEFFSIKALRD